MFVFFLNVCFWKIEYEKQKFKEIRGLRKLTTLGFSWNFKGQEGNISRVAAAGFSEYKAAQNHKPKISY